MVNGGRDLLPRCFFFFPELRAAKEQKTAIWHFYLEVSDQVLLTGCWPIWPSGRSSVGSCHPVCVGGTPLPLSCPEPWPSSTCSLPHSCRCHCGHRSQPGCPASTQKKKNCYRWPFLQGNLTVWAHSQGQSVKQAHNKIHQNWTSESSRLSYSIIHEPKVTLDFGLEGVHSLQHTTFPEGREVYIFMKYPRGTFWLFDEKDFNFYPFTDLEKPTPTGSRSLGNVCLHTNAALGCTRAPPQQALIILSWDAVCNTNVLQCYSKTLR